MQRRWQGLVATARIELVFGAADKERQADGGTDPRAATTCSSAGKGRPIPSARRSKQRAMEMALMLRRLILVAPNRSLGLLELGGNIEPVWRGLANHQQSTIFGLSIRRRRLRQSLNLRPSQLPAIDTDVG